MLFQIQKNNFRIFQKKLYITVFVLISPADYRHIFNPIKMDLYRLVEMVSKFVYGQYWLYSFKMAATTKFWRAPTFKNFGMKFTL